MKTGREAAVSENKTVRWPDETQSEVLKLTKPVCRTWLKSPGDCFRQTHQQTPI